MTECVFCKIINGEIPSAKIFEDENVLAFLDISPINKGHCLVVPKRHCKNIFDVPEDILSKLILAAKKISIAVKKGTNAAGINIQISNEKAAGQVVFHLHFHIIPRFENDGFDHWHGGKYLEGELQEYKNKIVSYLNK